MKATQSKIIHTFVVCNVVETYYESTTNQHRVRYVVVEYLSATNYNASLWRLIGQCLIRSEKFSWKLFTWSNCTFIKVTVDGQITQRSALSLWESEPDNKKETNELPTFLYKCLFNGCDIWQYCHSRVSIGNYWWPGGHLTPGHLQLIVMTKQGRRISEVNKIMKVESQPRRHNRQ